MGTVGKMVSPILAGLLVLCLAGRGQAQICKFQLNLEAECRYRIDDVSMSEIDVEINRCHDPLDVTFEIENERPEIHWSHSFSNNNEIVSVPGFQVDVKLQVFLTFDENKKLWIRADFITNDRKRAFFLDEKIDIKTEDCTMLNKAGKIAVGFLVVLIVISAGLVGVLLYVRRRRRLQNPHRTLEEVDSVSCTDLRGSRGGQPNLQGEPVVNFRTKGDNSPSTGVVPLDLGDGLAETVRPQSDGMQTPGGENSAAVTSHNACVA